MSAVQEFGFENPASDLDLQDMLGHYLTRVQALADLIQSYHPESKPSIPTLNLAGEMLVY